MKEGGISESFGIHVASLAGLPKEVIDNANEMLSLLHKQEATSSISSTNMDSTKKEIQDETLTKKSGEYGKLLKEMSELELEKIKPIDALNILNELVKKSKKVLKDK